MHPTQNRISGISPFALSSAMVGICRSVMFYFFNSLKNYALVQLARSEGEYFQGAPLFSTFPNIALIGAGACDSSITAYCRSSIIIFSGSMLTGHASTQALQVVQAQSSSRVI